MADNKAIKNGNWQDSTVWSLGRVPDATDDVYLNGYIVTINTDGFNYTVNSLNNIAGSGITAGGYINTTAGGTITANNGYNTAATYFFYNTNTADQKTIYVNGELKYNIASSGFINNAGAFTFRFNGNVTMSGGICIINSHTIGKTYYNGHAVLNGGTFASVSAGNIYITDTTYTTLNVGLLCAVSGGAMTITGDVYKQTNVNDELIISGGTLNIIGNIYASKTATGAKQNRLMWVSGYSGTVNLTGNIYSYDVVVASYGLILNQGTINVTGNIYGGEASGVWTIVSYSSGVAKVNVTGNVFGSTTNNNAYAIYDNNYTSTIDISGHIYGKVSTAILCIALSTVVKARGNMYSLNGISPVVAHIINVSPTEAQQIQLKDTDNVTRTFSTSNATGGLPAVNNVRYGVQFGVANEYTGTCRVPAASSVAAGVEVDNTVGTAIITAELVKQAVWGALTADMNTSGSIGQRLKNAATVASVGDQLAATNP